MKSQKGLQTQLSSLYRVTQKNRTHNNFNLSYIGPSNFFKFGRLKTSAYGWSFHKVLDNWVSLHIIFMFFPKWAPNGNLGVEGTLAYVGQNCQWLAHIPPMGFPWSLLWFLPSVHQLFEDCSHWHYPWDTPTDENLGDSSLVNALCGSTDEVLGIIGTAQRHRTVVPARWGPPPTKQMTP